MPDDSTPEFRAAQQRHGDKIRVERELMQLTGLSRTQIREGLRDFSQRFNIARPTPTKPTIPFVAPEVKVTTTEFKPRPLTLGQDNKGAPGGDSAANLAGGTVTVTLCKNAEPTDYVLFGREA